MEEPVFRPVSASMKKTAQDINDLKKRLDFIKENHQQLDDAVKAYNEFLVTAWSSPIRLYSDDEFEAQIMRPLQQVYEQKVYDISKLEAMTGRRRTR